MRRKQVSTSQDRRHAAVCGLWNDLIACCERAGVNGLDTDDFGYLLLQLGIASLALGFDDLELHEHNRFFFQSVETGDAALVNAARELRSASKLRQRDVRGGSVLDIYDREGRRGEWRDLLPALARLARFRAEVL